MSQYRNEFCVDKWIRWAILPNGSVRIYHPMEGAYFEFEGLGAELFKEVADGKTFNEILENLTKCHQTDLPREKVSKQAEQFLEKLVSEKFLKIVVRNQPENP